jgi:predicted lipoprotein with Yx(FWY)xxD motif
MRSVKSWSEPAGRLRRACSLAAVLLLLPADPGVAAEGAREAYRPVAMPPGFQVLPTELEGPVFADTEGRTLYTWPQHKLRNGYSGEAAGTPACYDEVLTVTAGLMSPYPAGIALPDIDNRPSCTDLWPPVLAPEGAEPVGDWTIVARRDGSRQWAYDEQPLYTSVRDQLPGDTFGGTRRGNDGDAPAAREPAGPPPLLPPGFSVATTSVGRMLATDDSYAVYAFDGDSATATACVGDCLRRWEPVLAPALARAEGEWRILERAPGVRQWVYRGQPLYRYRHDLDTWSQLGSDEPGWHNVFTQTPPSPPASFTRQATIAGDVLADSRGHTIYIYHCGDDSADQLSCDHPEDTQVYRLAMCGAGDPQRCLEYWPYVTAAEDARSSSRTWRVLSIDPTTGHPAAADSEGALRVWAYRDRPVYTFARDLRPGDVNGGGTGEWRGKRNGLKAFWLRDDFMEDIE